MARFLSRVVDYSGDAYRAVLTSAGPVACPATLTILEFSGVCCAPGEPSLVAEASGVNFYGGYLRSASPRLYLVEVAISQELGSFRQHASAGAWRCPSQPFRWYASKHVRVRVQ